MLLERNEINARKILEFFKDELKDAPCSREHHLCIKGGLLIHLENTFKIAKQYFPDDQRLQFFALIHDIGKARTYEPEGDKFEFRRPHTDHIVNTFIMLGEYHVNLSLEETNALQFHHGGWSHYRGDLTELAIKLHFCDSLATNILEYQNTKIKEE